MANPFVAGTIAIALAVIVLSYVLIPTVKGVNTETWSSGETTLFGVISLVAIMGLVYGVAQVFGLA